MSKKKIVMILVGVIVILAFIVLTSISWGSDSKSNDITGTWFFWVGGGYTEYSSKITFFDDGTYESGNNSVGQKFDMKDHLIFLRGKGAANSVKNLELIIQDGQSVLTDHDKVLYFRTEEEAKRDYNNKKEIADQEKIEQARADLIGIWYGSEKERLLVITENQQILTEGERVVTMGYEVIDEKTIRIINPDNRDKEYEYDVTFSISKTEKKINLKMNNQVYSRDIDIDISE